MPTIVLANPLCSYHASTLRRPKGLPSRQQRPTYPATATHQLAAWSVVDRRGCLPVACSVAPTNLPTPPPKLQPAQPRLVGCMLILSGLVNISLVGLAASAQANLQGAATAFVKRLDWGIIGVMVSLMAFLVSLLGTIYFVATRLERINVVQESYNRLETTMERLHKDSNKRLDDAILRLDQKFSELKAENNGIKQQLTTMQQDLYYMKGLMEGSQNFVNQKQYRAQQAAFKRKLDASIRRHKQTEQKPKANQEPT